MLDHYLIAKCQSRTTGANSHLIGNALHVYMAYSEIADAHDDLPNMVNKRDEYERRLRAFCVTGRVESLRQLVGI